MAFGSLRGVDERVDRDRELVDRLVDEVRFGLGAGGSTTGGGSATGSATGSASSAATGLPDQSVAATDGTAAFAPMILGVGADVG